MEACVPLQQWCAVDNNYKQDLFFVLFCPVILYAMLEVKGGGRFASTWQPCTVPKQCKKASEWIRNEKSLGSNCPWMREQDSSMPYCYFTIPLQSVIVQLRKQAEVSVLQQSSFRENTCFRGSEFLCSRPDVTGRNQDINGSYCAAQKLPWVPFHLSRQTEMRPHAIHRTPDDWSVVRV